MKRTLCLLVGLIAGSAWAAPSTSWIEVSYGELERQSEFSPSQKGDGNEARLAAAYATSATGYMRIDFMQQANGIDIEPLTVGDEASAGMFVVADTVIDVDEWRMELERDVTTLTGGLKSPLNSGVDLIGEIGVARINYEVPHYLISSSTPGEADSISIGSTATEETGAIGRLGLMAEDDGVAWGATMEWYNKMPSGIPFQEADSARWWNAYVGYQITPNWTVSLRYADTEQFKTKGISVRWTL